MIEIKHRHTGAVLWSGEAETLRDAVVAAVKCGADLGGADLGDAINKHADIRRCAEEEAESAPGADHA